MLNPFVELLSELLHLYMLCVIVWTVMAVLISFKIVNAHQPIMQKVMYALNRLVDPALRPIQRMLQKLVGDLGGVDISPIILILLLNFARSSLYTYLYNL